MIRFLTIEVALIRLLIGTLDVFGKEFGIKKRRGISAR